MTVYMVERDLKGISMDDLADAQQRAIAASKEHSDGGDPVRYIRSTFVPDEGKCMCLFEAENAKAVREVNDEAHIPYDRVVPAMDLTP